MSMEKFYEGEYHNCYFYKLNFGKYLVVNKFSGAWAVFELEKLNIETVKKLIEQQDFLQYLKTKKYEIKLDTFLSSKNKKNLTIIFPNCNLNCKYCYMHDFLMNKKFDVSPMKVILFCKKFNFKRITFHGGEPLLYFDWIKKFVSLAESFGFDFEYTIQTNATLVNEEIARFFKKHNFSVGISLDGPKFINDANRVFPNGSGSFEKIMNSIKILRKSDVQFKILITITELFLQNSDEIINFFKERNLHYLFNVPFLTSNFGRKPKFLNRFSSFLKSYSDKFGFDEAVLNLHGFSSFFTPNINPKNPEKVILRDNCGAGINALTIYPDNSASICPLLFNFRKINSFLEPENKFFWELSSVRKNLDTRLDFLNHQSYKNPFLPLHKNLCPARSLLVSKDFDKDYLIPVYEKLFIHFLKHINKFYEQVPFVHKRRVENVFVYTIFKSKIL